MGTENSGVQFAPNGDGYVRAVVHEVIALMQQLLETGEGGSVDLSSMPLSDEDYDLLEAVLGEGEVDVDVHTVGATRLYETGVSGVWWVTHFNADDEVMAEFIEVAYCPEILLSPKQDVAHGLEVLRAHLIDAHLSD